MKKLLFLTRVVLVSAALALAASCSKVDAPASINEMASDYPESEAMENFVEILSRAVSQSEDVRSFLKEKALEQVDNDYDVFYPFVRDEKINDRYSFREYLVSCSDEAALSKIEQRLPLLTIYIPDLTWIKEDAFSVNSWDISSNEVLVCNMDEEGTRHFYYEGKEELVLKSGEGIVSAPFLVVKNNERIKATGSTKAGNVQYEFISPVFDGRSANTKGVKTWFECESGNLDNTDTISASDLNRIAPDAARAYHEFKGMYAAAQRDYCFYGMTAKSAKGAFNNNVKDRLFRFKVDPSALQIINDTTDPSKAHADPLNLVGGAPYVEYSDNGDNRTPAPLSYEACVEKLAHGGKYEFEITAYYGTSTGVASTKIYLDVDVRDVFSFGWIKVEEHGPALFRWNRIWKLFVEKNQIKSKWYYPKTNLYLPAWNLYNGATSLYLVFKEIDAEQEISTSETVTTTTTVGVDPKIKFSEKYELGLNAQYQRTKTTTVEIKEKVGSDEMGEIPVSYLDPYVRTASPNDKNPTSYTLMSYSTGRVTVSFLPDNLYY